MASLLIKTLPIFVHGMNYFSQDLGWAASLINTFIFSLNMFFWGHGVWIQKYLHDCSFHGLI